MTERAINAVLRRDRVVVAASLVIVTALAWAYVLWLADDMAMGGMEMAEVRMVPAGLGLMMPAIAPWQPFEFAFVFVMWAVMMVGMMTPSAAPMVLLYAHVGRQAGHEGKPFAATAWFMAGYLLVWSGFALFATGGQWALDRAALLSPPMASESVVLGGIVLLAAGLYQWTPLKDSCLRQCQTPLLFIQSHGGFKRDVRGTLVLGIRHGFYCVGCCWLLMALLFVGGVMNVLWIATISIFVLAEKVIPVGRLLARAAGVGFIAAGMWLLAPLLQAQV